MESPAPMDPLSDVLSLLKPRSYMFRGFDVGGEWSIQFPRHGGIKCYAVVSGQCWLSVEGVPDPVRVKSGDCFLLPRGLPFRLASDMSLPPVDALTVFSAGPRGDVASYNGGGDYFGVGGYFDFAGDHANVLLGVLPPIVHIREEADKAALRWSMERMMQELRDPQPGGFLMAQHLAHMMLVQALRIYLAEGLRGGVSWLFALADKQMGAAISAMHADPAHPWTLQELAHRAGMSRSSFALKFKETVGASPMDYLTRWRMLRAGDRLAHSGDAVSTIALSLGYESESAFSTAFKRVMGSSPRQYGRRRDSAAPALSEREAFSAERFEPVAG
jgi:AraC-like DNA-binding protein